MESADIYRISGPAGARKKRNCAAQRGCPAESSHRPVPANSSGGEDEEMSDHDGNIAALNLTLPLPPHSLLLGLFSMAVSGTYVEFTSTEVPFVLFIHVFGYCLWVRKPNGKGFVLIY